MRSEYIDKNSYNSLFQKMQYENVLAMRVCLETGLRIDDVLSLKPENIKNNCTIYCTAKKTGKKAVKKISKALYIQLVKNSGEFWVFPSPKNKELHRTRQAVWCDIKKAGRVYGSPDGISPHSARKTYAVDTLREKGMGAVQKELQHSRLDTTMLYAFSDLMCGKRSAPSFNDFELDKFASVVAEKIIEYLKQTLGKRL
jgi:integrase